MLNLWEFVCIMISFPPKFLGVFVEDLYHDRPGYRSNCAGINTNADITIIPLSYFNI